ncbi:GNAT family N-acetyltransferase [Catenovulum sediminis]|nr:GNAT family protein [Catenovulum sediminis]
MEFSGLFVSFRKIEPDDIERVADWLHSDVFRENLYAIPLDKGMSKKDIVIDFIKKNSDDYHPDKYFVIEEKKNKNLVGLTLFNNLDWKNRTVEYNYIIGDPARRNGIYGSDISLAICNYAFNSLNLNKVIGYTYEFNKQAQRVNNFIADVEGVLVAHHKHQGRYIDVIIHSLSKRKFS